MARFINKTLAKEYGMEMAAQESNPKWRQFFAIYYSYLTRIINNLYRWEGLPDSMDKRFLEMCLMQDGVAGLTDDPMFGPINTRATWGQLGFYNIPIRSTFYNLDYTREVYVGRDSTNSVLILNNATGEGYAMIAIYYAKRLAEIAITHGLNLKAQRTPITIDGDYSQLEQLSKAYMDYMSGAPVIAQRRSAKKIKINTGDYRPLNALRTDAPFVADKIYSEFVNVLNEFFAMVGINFVNNNKRERMLVDEVNANNQQLQISYSAGLVTRQEAAEQYNKIHGTNITVHHNEMIGEIINERTIIENSGQDQLSSGNGGVSDI